jgi:hypothetical protein
MTLILGMNNPEGIYLSADYRVTHEATGERLSDEAVKSLVIHYPPIGSTTKLVVAFSGLAESRRGTPMMAWLMRTLRGEIETIEQSMTHLRSRLDRDIARWRSGFIINVMGFAEGRRFMGGFTNKMEDGSILPKFSYYMEELSTQRIFANGTGSVLKGAYPQYERLKKQLGTTPDDPLNYMKLLAEMNRKIAEADRSKSVSPFCHVTFLNADDRFLPSSHAFTRNGESVPRSIPVIAYGIDLDELSRQFFPDFENLFKGEDLPPSEIDMSRLKRRS